MSFLWCLLGRDFRAVAYIATSLQMLYNLSVEYPFPPVGIVGAADGKNRRAFFFSAALPEESNIQLGYSQYSER